MLASKLFTKQISSLLKLLLLLIIHAQLYLAAIQLPYGLEEGDEQLQFPATDAQQIVARALPVGHQFTYFERSHTTLFISRNGAISFDTPFDTNVKELDLERKDIIAVFYTQSSDGAIFYRYAEGNSLLSKELSAKIRRAFSANQFEADFVVLVTWDELLDEQSQANTFQLGLAANSNETYTLLVYSTIKWSKVNERFAQAGFFSADGRSEKLLNSGGPSIGDVIRVTNFNEPGMYIYRISGTHPIDPRFGLQKARDSGEEEYEYQHEQQEYEQEDQIAECPPDPYRDNCPPNCNLVLDDNHCSLCICSKVDLPSLTAADAHSAGAQIPPVPTTQRSTLRTPDFSCTPSQGQVQCHASANCLQQQNGYCCQCENGYFGNGVECLSKEGPLRINGAFEAAINGKMVPRTDLFSYIQPQDGQQHTALAKIQPEFGWSLLLLDSLSTQFGWLFAKTKQDRQQNGFELTGGNFTRVVNIHLGERYALIIRQEFIDRQFSEHFSVNMFVSGTLPELQGPVHVSIPEFEETYKQERPGLIRAYSERFILLRGNGSPLEETKFRVTIDQKIHFTECPYKQSPKNLQTTVKFERLNANYNEAEMVVRFASQCSIIGESDGPEQRLHGIHENACTSGHHFCTLPNMICVPIPMNPFYRCECRNGFRLIEDNTVEQRMTCQQVDQQSDIVQQIQQQQTTASTPLQPGECIRHDQCHQWGECVFGPLPGQSGKCKCRGWYVGDGLTHCGPPDQPPHADLQPQTTDKSTICRADTECGDNAKCEYSPSHGYYVCICQRGWQGDGIDCVTVPEPGLDNEENIATTSLATIITLKAREDSIIEEGKKQCTDSSDCNPFGSCMFFEQTNSYFCACLPGYQGDGVEKCEHSEECSPTEPSHACSDPNQECSFEQLKQKFACQCRSGFMMQPDGKCTYEFAAQSNQCQLCGANAQCVKKVDEWNCICNPGYTGNGFDCHRKATCLDEPTMCGSNAQCLPNGLQSYNCVCNYGYIGDGRNCEPNLQRTREMESLMIGRGMAIIHRSVQTNESGKQLIVQPHQIVVDIDYDCSTGRIYWSDISGHSIRSALLNGTGINIQFSNVLRAPEGIAIDWLAKNIYYLDSIKNELGVLSADGRFQKTLLKNGLNNPRALVIDLEGRQLYYSDWSRDGPRIGRIGLDGSNQQIFISDDIHLPNGLVLLQQRRWLCWVDAGNQKLSCIGLDGTGRRVIFSPLEYPFGLTVNNQEERFYWTDWKDQKIHSVDVFGKGHNEFLPGAGGRGKLYGILSFPVKCHSQLAQSECSHQNGGCTHWCLTGSRPGLSSCVCPDNAKELEGC